MIFPMNIYIYILYIYIHIYTCDQPRLNKKYSLLKRKYWKINFTNI